MADFKVGEYVRNIGKNSCFYGRVGKIIAIDFCVHVKYECEYVIGRHPRKILIKSETHFEEDMFTLK